MEVRTLTKSLCGRIENGQITLHDAARELHKAGHFNYVPSASQTKEYLRKCEGEDRELEVISTRDLFLNNLSIYLEVEKKDRTNLTRYSPSLRRAIKDLEVIKTGNTIECRRYNDDGETYEKIQYSDIDETTLVIWNQFIQKHMWNVPGVTMDKVFRI